MSLPPYAEVAKDQTIRVLVWVQPGAKRDSAEGVADGRLRVKLKAQALENKANEALVAFLAKQMGVPRSALTLSAGQTSRRKTIRVEAGYEPDWRVLDEATR